MNIRLAEDRDHNALADMAREFARHAGIDHLTGENIGEIANNVFSLDSVFIYLAEDREILGGIGVMVAPFIWNPELTEMTEIFFWVYPDASPFTALALLRRVLKDAAHVDMVTFSRLETSPENLDTVYARLGFEIHETVYRKVL